MPSYTDNSFYKITDHCDVYIITTKEIKKYISEDNGLYKINMANNLNLLNPIVKNKLISWIQDNSVNTVYFYKKVLYFTDKNDYLMFRLSRQ